ncbi:hypothetical protein [Nitratifractor sp.]
MKEKKTEKSIDPLKELRSLYRGMIFAIVIVSVAVVNIAVLYSRMPVSDWAMQLLLLIGVALLGGLILYTFRIRKKMKGMR